MGDKRLGIGTRSGTRPMSTMTFLTSSTEGLPNGCQPSFLTLPSLIRLKDAPSYFVPVYPHDSIVGTRWFWEGHRGSYNSGAKSKGR